MLVSLEDMRGTTYWVNPMFVREIAATRNGCKMSFSGGKTIRIPIDAATLAVRLNEGMPLPSEAIVALLDENTRIQQQQQATSTVAL